MSAPNVKVLVDWNNDGLFCEGVISTDAPNLDDDPDQNNKAAAKFASHALTTFSTGTDTTITWEPIDERFGYVEVKADTSTDTGHNRGGVTFGWDYGTSAMTDHHDFQTTLSNEDYSFVVWVRATVNTGDMMLEVRNDSGTVLAQETITPPTDNVWRQYSVSFTQAGARPSCGLSVTNHNTNNPGNRPVFSVSGLMFIKSHTVPSNYNSGSVDTEIYDDLTSYLLSAKTKCGHSNTDDLFFSEGTLNVSLKNPDGLFSPGNSTSPLYGVLNNKNRIRLDLLRPSTGVYEPIWVGWVERLTPKPLKGDTDKAELRAIQGRFLLDTLPISFQAQSDMSMSAALLEITTSGFYSPLDRMTTVADVSTELTAFATDLDVSLDIDGSRFHTFEYLGDKWERGKTSPSKALKDMMQVDRGWLLMSRTGSLVYRPRYYYSENATPSYAVDIPTEVTQETYKYGEHIENFIKVTYHPKLQEDDTTIYTTLEPIEVGRRSNKTVTVKVESESDTKLTPLSINSFAAASNPSTWSAATKNGKAITRVAVSANVVGDEIEISIQNAYRRPVFVTISLVGSLLKSFGGQSLELIDEDSVAAYRLQPGSAVSSHYITNEVSAQSLGQYILNRYSEPYGVYQKMKMEHYSFDDTVLEKMMNITIGELVEISDTKIADSTENVVVVGEQWDFTPGHAKTTYTLGRLPDPGVWILGTSKLDTEAYLGY